MECFFDNETIWNFYNLEWNKIFKLFGIEKFGMLLDNEFLKYSDLRTVFDINTTNGLANFYELTKLKYVFALISVLHLDLTSKKSAKRSGATLPAATYTPEVQGHMTEGKKPSHI